MSRRNKLQKFADILTFPNVYESYDAGNPQLTGIDGIPIDLCGKWQSEHFKNDAPLTLELACGRGEYTIDLARRYADRNFIGVDIKGARIWQGAKKAMAEELNNAAFLRTRIERIAHFFAPQEVAEIWITFPDPFLRESKANRRLTAGNFIDHYRKILKPGGLVHLKTDETNLYEFTLEVLNEKEGCEIIYQNDDIYASELAFPELETSTYYEKLHRDKGKTIKYVRFLIN